jgi:aminoglycoside 6'-N-acetyltransferase I
MIIVDLTTQTVRIREAAAAMLVNDFDEPRGWPSLEGARDETARIVRDGLALARIEADALLGWVGGLPEYHGRVWELHPLVVGKENRLRGIGRSLVEAFETEVRRRGGLTVTLGTDDDSGMTSLANADLYAGVPRHIAQIQDLGRRHPFLFYRKLGYVVTGVMPDANGPGRPDIFMSKSMRQ